VKKLRLRKMLAFTVLLSINHFSLAKENLCHPPVDSKLPQHLIGYGSLMNEQSKKATAPDAGDGLPVWIKGFKRGWFSRADMVGGPTFLGIVKQPEAEMNAAIFSIPLTAIEKYDEREKIYCREAVLPNTIRSLTSLALPQGEIWIYVSPKESVKLPTKNYPLIESYVDIFLSGCLQLEKKFKIEGFAQQCIKTTKGWSPYWENDRLLPRRPWQYQPDALAIDKLLLENLPILFHRIKQPIFK
jgi:hypothetical protein